MHFFHVAAVWPRAVKHKEADRIPDSPCSKGQVTYKWKRKWPGIHCLTQIWYRLCFQKRVVIDGLTNKNRFYQLLDKGKSVKCVK